MLAPALPFPRLPDFFRPERFRPRMPGIVRPYECRDRVTGARIRNTDGTRNRATELTSCPPCVGCDCTTGCNTGTSPASGTVVASTIDFTTCVGTCAHSVSTSVKVTSTPRDPNGTITLTQSGSFCCDWAQPVTTVGTADRFDVNATCSGSPSASGSLQWGWVLQKFSNRWELSFLATTPGLGGPRMWLFDASITTVDPINCNPASLSFTNNISSIGTYTDSSGFPGWGVGTGGSATVTFP